MSANSRSVYKLTLIEEDEDYTFDIDSMTISDSEGMVLNRNENFTSVMDNYDEVDAEMTFIQTKDTSIKDPKIESFINFCIKKNLFDDTFYDYSNTFSVIATKLPKTFDKISKNGKDIDKKRFVRSFSKLRYAGDSGYIFKMIDVDKKGFVTWDEFKDFFLPYVKNITVYM